MKRFVKTLKGKMVLVLLLILIPFLVLITVNIEIQRKNWKNQQIAKAEEEIAVYCQSVNTTFQILEERMVYLPVENDVFRQLSRYTPDKQKSQAYWHTVVKVNRQLSSIQKIGSYVENVFAFFPEQNLYMNTTYNEEMQKAMISVIDMEQKEWDASWNLMETSRGPYLYRIYGFDTFYLGCWMPCESILKYFTASETENRFSVFLCDTQGNTLTGELTEKFPFENSLAGRLERQNALYTFTYAAHPGIYLMKELTKEQLRLPGTAAYQLLLLVMLLLILLVLLVSAGITRWVLQPVRNLVDGMTRIGNGDVSYRLSGILHTSQEFALIETEFNQMLDRLENMRIKMYEQELEQKESKLRYLSQQIQPHFILNSLNTLYIYSKRDPEITREIIQLLSKYYRYVVNVESRYVCLEAELEHIENYLRVQKVRLARKMDYDIYCEDGVKIVPIPPFLLESFVGNVLKYGQDENNHIQLSLRAVQIKPFVICITIQDQGAGFPGEILDSLEEYRKTGNKNGFLGTGICNSMERLMLIYGSKADIRFYNMQGAVVEITIHLLAEETQETGGGEQ